jgi:hypothetical protein
MYNKTVCVYLRPPGFFGWLFYGWYISLITKNLASVLRRVKESQAEGLVAMATLMPYPLPWKFWFLPRKAAIVPITKLTAFIIATRGDDIRVTSAFSQPDGKWVGWITLGEEDRYRPLLDSGPKYDSAEEAETGMRLLIEELKQRVKEECGDKHPLDHIFDKVNHELEGQGT